MAEWTKDTIQTLLEKDDRAVARAVVAIYRRQTSEEQQGQKATEHNREGFSRYDAKILSDYAAQLLRGTNLSPNQLGYARKKVKRYWRQLLIIAREREAQRTADRQPSLLPIT